jgi:hypothetical protein
VTLYKGNWKVEETNAEDNFKQNEAKMESIIVKEPGRMVSGKLNEKMA